MAEQIDPSPAARLVAAAVFTAITVVVAELTAAVLMVATKRWILPAWIDASSPQSPIAVDVDPGGQLVEQLGGEPGVFLAREPIAADQLDDQTAAADVDGLEAIAE